MKELQRIYFENEDFIILNDQSHLSIIEDSADKWMRVIACQEGELTGYIDDRAISLKRNDILFITSEQNVSRVMISAGFRFIMFALSKQINSEIFPSSAVVWQTFRHIRQPAKSHWRKKMWKTWKSTFIICVSVCRIVEVCFTMITSGALYRHWSTGLLRRLRKCQTPPLSKISCSRRKRCQRHSSICSTPHILPRAQWNGMRKN